METKTQGEASQTTVVISKDGTPIAYDKSGQGPVLIIVSGALAQRQQEVIKNFAATLAKKFTVIIYDRRGRGESGDTKPYSVQKEIEDIEALIQEAGGSANLFGSSSGAALALLAAETLGPGKVKKLALYEPPYGSDTEQAFADEKQKVNQLVREGRPEEAVLFFMESRGMQPDQLEGLKSSPEWKGMVQTGPTLVYDFVVMGDGAIPVKAAKNIEVPTLVMDGEKSPAFMHITADSLGKLIPRAERKTLKDQMHNVAPEAVMPVLVEFFE